MAYIDALFPVRIIVNVRTGGFSEQG
jgi:hypothetical protein